MTTGPGHGRIAVIGGAVVDTHAQPISAPRPATSNPGTVRTSHGGVGRNIAENLARLGCAVDLVAVVGDDNDGAAVVAGLRDVGVGVEGIVVSADRPTGRYVAVLDDAGELQIGIADLSATDALTPGDLGHVGGLLDGAAYLVIDGNLPPAVVGWLLDEAARRELPVVLEPVSVAKAARLAGELRADRPVFVVTPSSGELAALAGESPSAAAELTYVDRLAARGVRHVWLRQGEAGSVVSIGAERVTFPALAADVVDVTGAGDAMTAGFVSALVGGGALHDAVRAGHFAAALTVESHDSVRRDLTHALIAQRSSPLDTTEAHI